MVEAKRWHSEIRKRGEDEQGVLILEQIRTFEQLEGVVSPKEWEQAQTLKGDDRRAEWLMSRAMIREELARRGFEPLNEPLVDYLPSGAPCLIESVERYKANFHISISHCKGFVAIAFSLKKCAVDIERSDREVEHLAPRFLSEYEQSLAAHCGVKTIALWCAKEALYKFAQCQGVELARDLNVEVISQMGSQTLFECSIIGEQKEVGLFLREEGEVTILSTI